MTTAASSAVRRPPLRYHGVQGSVVLSGYACPLYDASSRSSGRLRIETRPDPEPMPHALPTLDEIEATVRSEVRAAIGATLGPTVREAVRYAVREHAVDTDAAVRAALHALLHDREWLDSASGAAYVGVARRTFQDHTSAGHFGEVARRFGRDYVRREAVDIYITAGTAADVPPEPGDA